MTRRETSITTLCLALLALARAAAASGWEATRRTVIARASVHFGLGDASEAEEIVILWPSGIADVVRNIRADGRHTVVEASGYADPRW